MPSFQLHLVLAQTRAMALTWCLPVDRQELDEQAEAGEGALVAAGLTTPPSATMPTLMSALQRTCAAIRLIIE